MMEGIFLLLGSNLGDKRALIMHGVKEIELLGYDIIQQSLFYKTQAWGYEKQDSFINIAVEISSNKSPHNMLEEIKIIESKAGDPKPFKWGPRFLDIDILFYGDQLFNEKNLNIPHPEIQNRKFVLEPLNEIAPEFIHPVLKKSISELLSVCEDPALVEMIPY